MTRKKYSFWIDDAQADGLKLVKERDGVLESKNESDAQSMTGWTKKGVNVKTERPRAVTRKRGRRLGPQAMKGGA